MAQNRSNQRKKLNPERSYSKPAYTPGLSSNAHASKLAQAKTHVETIHQGTQEFRARVIDAQSASSPWYSVFLSAKTKAYTVKVDLRALFPHLLSPNDLPPGIKNVSGIKDTMPGEFEGLGDEQPEVGDYVVITLYDRHNPALGGRVVEVIKTGVAGLDSDSTNGTNKKTSKGVFKNPCDDTKPSPNISEWTLERTAAAVDTAADATVDILTTAAQFWGIMSKTPKKTPSSYTDSRPKTTTVAKATTPQPGQQVRQDALESPTPLPQLEIPGCGPKFTISESAKRSLSDEQLCTRAGIPCEVLAAVRHVESRGNPGALRFEPHLWHRRRPDLRDRVPYTPNPSKGFSTTSSETGKIAFARAFELDPAMAIKCTSFGLYQVMGWALLDAYDGNPEKAWEGFRKNPSEASDLMLIAWMNKNPRAKKAANSSPPNFTAFAKIYNGPNFAVNAYDVKMYNFWRNNR
tara:strand:+ start:2037 stop:3422 length:1386 start_codon:yes stop_codon:yes gene_type:complete